MTVPVGLFSKSNYFISLHFSHWFLRKIDWIYFSLHWMQNEWGTGRLNSSFHSKWCPTSSVRTMKSQFIKIDTALIQSLITNRCSVFCFDIHFVSQNWPQLTKHPKMTFFTIFGILIHHYETSKLTNSRYISFWLGHSWRFKMSKANDFQFSGS